MTETIYLHIYEYVKYMYVILDYSDMINANRENHQLPQQLYKAR